MIKRSLGLLLALLTLLPLALYFPLPVGARSFTLTRYFSGDTSDWEIWGGTTSLVLNADGVNADDIAADIDGKTGKYAWYLAFNGGGELRIDPATCARHSPTNITLRFPTYACGFSPSYNPAGGEDNRIYYDLSLRVENTEGQTLYTASVSDLHSTLTDPQIKDTVTLDGSRSGNGFATSLPSGKSTTAMLFTVKDAAAPTLWEHRGDYRWHLVYEDRNGRHEQDLFPSAFDGNTLFYFEPCLGAPSFVPKRDHTYFVTLELWQEDRLCYFAGGTIYGYHMDHDAIYSDTSYTITWQVNGQSLTTSVFEGATPFYPKGTPEKEHPDKSMRYRFTGWEPAVAPATKDQTYTAVFIEEKMPLSVTFSIDGRELSKIFYKNDLPAYPYTFEEQRADGLYDLFLGFDREITPVSKDTVYTGSVKKGVAKKDLDLFALTHAEIPQGGRAVVYLTAKDPISSFAGIPVYDRDRFTLEEVGFAEGISGSFSETILSFSCQNPKKGIVATLVFSCKEGASGGYALDLLPIQKDEKGRPAAVEDGYLQITGSLHGDADQNGLLEDRDVTSYLLALGQKAGQATLDDCYPDGLLSPKDLSALLCRLSGDPFPLYKTADDRTLIYSVKAGGAIKEHHTQTLGGDEKPLAVVTEPLSSCYTFLGWSDGYGSACRKDVFAVCSDSYEAVYIETVPQLQIPTLQINTGGKDITSNVDYISATVSTNGCEDAHKITKAKARIRGRGNAAWDTFKNYKPSYKLNFNEQISLFGLGGADKDWLLISTVTDKSFLRNYAIQRLGHLLSGNEWSPSCMFIEVYLNGDYRGVYLLCEQIEANGHKLDLDDEKEEADKDYLLELDHRASWKGDDPLTYFEIPGGQQPFVIQSTVNSAKERTFIRKEVLNLHNALMSGNEKEIRALCDMGALVDNYIIQEFGHNRDVGFASFYFYRKDGLFYFGPPWDFDLGLGNDRDYPNALNEIYSNGGRGNHWFESLYKQVWFRRLVKKRMAEIEPMILTVEGEVRMMGQALEGAAQRNYQRFPVLGSPVFLEPAETAAFTSYEQHVSYLCDWMQKRWQFLKKTIR